MWSTKRIEKLYGSKYIPVSLTAVAFKRLKHTIVSQIMYHLDKDIMEINMDFVPKDHKNRSY